MKKFNLKRVVLNPVFSSTNEKRKRNLTLKDFIEDKYSIENVVFQLTALMLTLPIITALLLMFLKNK